MLKMQRKAANLRAILNDLKRNDEVAARELEVPLEDLKTWLLAEKPVPADVLAKAATIWTVNTRDFEVVDDDAPSGVRIMRAEESQATERVLSRAGAPYYAYRDTAMSRTAAFRPEWIEELVAVDDNDPDNPRVQWNNGHFLHQFTYFIGPVNFYYLEDGVRRVAEMKTGDTMYISPFVPHSFATRTNEEGVNGLILALTFGGRVFGDTQQELAIVGSNFISKVCSPGSIGNKAFAGILQRHIENALLPYPTLAERSGLTEERLTKLIGGDSTPSFEEIEALASALRMNIRDLLPFDREQPAVVVLDIDHTEALHVGSYIVKELASTSLIPDMRSFELEVPTGGLNEAPFLETSLFQYAYVLGQGSVGLEWNSDNQSHKAKLAPNDSFVMKPGVSHRFICTDESTKILLLRIGGRLSNEVLLELSNLSESGLKRAIQEDQPWFDAAGKHYRN
jgi:transcriptional regulator with XRE-family HTH domain